MDLGIAGKVAFISGGSKGIGRASAELLAAEGVKVVLVATGKDALEHAVADIRERDGQAVGVVADLTAGEEIEQAVSEGTDAFGPPDIVIFNGVFRRDSERHGPPGAARYATPAHPEFFDQTDEQLVANVERVLFPVSALTRIVAPHMMEQGWGRLVNIGTAAADHASPGAASAVVLQKSLANELGCYGITVNYLGVGAVATQNMYDYVEMLAATQGVTRDAALHQLSSGNPMQRVGKPEEVAAAVAFLCSEGAGYINGEFIGVSGGSRFSAF
jgi:3-oxoacyl-[acyl-carrier protein] reductase